MSNSYYHTTLGKLPDKPRFDLHYWADYIELQCTTNVDGVYTQDDFVDAYKNRSTDLFEGVIENDSEDIDDATDNWFQLNEATDKAYKDDKDYEFASSIFRILSSREGGFQDYYPFSISSDNRQISLAHQITIEHRSYMFLLLCSALNYFNNNISELTKSFEVLSLQVLKKLLPPNAEAHLFGSNNSLIDRKFTGNLWTKINALAKELKDITKGSKDDHPITDAGDGGLDLIAWYPGDNMPHKLIITGQAGCTPDWDLKQFSSSYSAWKNKIAFSVTPINVVFIPYSLRKANGEWHRRTDIGDVVMMDRKRILDYMGDDLSLLNNLPSKEVVDNFINNKGSVYN